MKKIVFAFFILMLTLPSYAQDAPVEAIPACTAEELILLPNLLLESGFLLDYALVSFSAPDADGHVDYLPSILEMLAVRDVWVEAIAPNLPKCVQSVELQIVMGDFLDQSLIQMLTSTVIDPADVSFADREDIEMARLQGFDLEINTMFEILFADMDLEARLIEQMEARESADG